MLADGRRLLLPARFSGSYNTNSDENGMVNMGSVKRVSEIPKEFSV